MTPLKVVAGEIRGMLLILTILGFPFSVAAFYVKMNIDTALLKRKVALAGIEQQELERKNGALREAMARISDQEQAERLYWKRYGTLPYYENNRVVTLRLPDAGESEKN